MKAMHPIIVECVGRLEKALEMKALNKENNELELKKMMSNLTMDVIARCAFGTEIDAYDETHRSQFVKTAEKVFKPSLRLIALILLKPIPGLLKLLKIRAIDPSVENFFRPAVSFRQKAVLSKRYLVKKVTILSTYKS